MRKEEEKIGMFREFAEISHQIKFVVLRLHGPHSRCILKILISSDKFRCALSPKITHENGGILLDGTIVNKTRAKNVDHQLSRKDD